MLIQKWGFIGLFQWTGKLMIIISLTLSLRKRNLKMMSIIEYLHISMAHRDCNRYIDSAEIRQESSETFSNRFLSMKFIFLFIFNFLLLICFLFHKFLYGKKSESACGRRNRSDIQFSIKFMFAFSPHSHFCVRKIIRRILILNFSSFAKKSGYRLRRQIHFVLEIFIFKLRRSFALKVGGWRHISLSLRPSSASKPWLHSFDYITWDLSITSFWDPTTLILHLFWTFMSAFLSSLEIFFFDSLLRNRLKHYFSG